MEPIVIETNHYCLPFMELDEATREQVMMKYGDWNVDHEWWDCIYDWFAETMHDHGVEVDLKKTNFSGFCHQGAGAAWTGYVTDLHRFIEKHCDEKFKRVLLFMSDNGFLATKAEPSGFSGMNQRASIAAENPHEQFVTERYMRAPTYKYEAVSGQVVAYNHADAAIDHFEYVWEQFCIDQADELYVMLEREYDWLTGIEALTESFDSNDVVFEINTGEMFHLK